MSLNLKKQAKAEAERARRDKATYLTELREDDPKLRELMSKFQIEFNKNWRDFDPDPILRKYPVTVGKYYRVLGVDPKLFWQRYLYRTNEEHMIKKLKRKSKSDERNHENGDSNKTPWNVGLKPTTTRDYSISPKSSPKQSVKTPWKTFKYAHTMPESAVGPKPVTPKSVKSKLKHYNSMPEQEVNTSTYRKDGKPNVGTSVKDRMKNWVDLSSSERTTSSVPEVDDQQVPALEEKQPKPKKSGGVKEWLKKKKGHHVLLIFAAVAIVHVKVVVVVIVHVNALAIVLALDFLGRWVVGPLLVVVSSARVHVDVSITLVIIQTFRSKRTLDFFLSSHIPKLV